eukprot:3941515-Rhodomonas_salina.4
MLCLPPIYAVSTPIYDPAAVFASASIDAFAPHYTPRAPVCARSAAMYVPLILPPPFTYHPCSLLLPPSFLLPPPSFLPPSRPFPPSSLLLSQCCAAQPPGLPAGEEKGETEEKSQEEAAEGEEGERENGEKVGWGVDEVDHYLVLGVPRDFTSDELKQAYRKVAYRPTPALCRVRYWLCVCCYTVSGTGLAYAATPRPVLT